MYKNWVKPLFILVFLFLLLFFLPNKPIDPWKLLNLKKMATMLFALAFIQIIGSKLSEFMGLKAGAFITGFLGGLISSTATTASLARNSRLSKNNITVESIIFLSATLAMLFEGLIMTIVGTHELKLTLFIIFLGPILMTLFFIVIQSKKMTREVYKNKKSEFNIGPLVKLTLFIILILAISQAFQNIFGHVGLFVLTFLVSLFEIHGSMIANIQLFEANTFDIQSLASLLSLSILASYVSKLFLVLTLADKTLKKQIIKYTASLLMSLLTSWVLIRFL